MKRFKQARWLTAALSLGFAACGAAPDEGVIRSPDTAGLDEGAAAQDAGAEEADSIGLSADALSGDNPLDASFGGDGKYTFRESGVDFYANGAAIQANGKTLVVGTGLFSDGSTKMQVLRLNVDGSPDTTWSAGPAGVRSYRFSGMTSTEGRAIKLVGNKIVLGGGAQDAAGKQTALVVRIGLDGSLDKTWNGTGYIKVDVPGASEVVAGLATDRDGRTLVLASRLGGDVGPAVFRLDTDGSVDTSLNPSNDGMRVLKPSYVGGSNTGEDGSAVGIAVVPSGMSTDAILVATADLVYKIQDDGSLDKTFGISGGYRTHLNTTAMALGPKGTIYLGGTSSAGTFSIECATRTGKLDDQQNLCIHGINSVDWKISTAEWVQSLWFDANVQRVYAAGTATINGHREFALAALRPDMKLDTSMDDGKMETDFGDLIDESATAVTSRSGKVVVVGYGGNKGLSYSDSGYFGGGIARYDIERKTLGAPCSSGSCNAGLTCSTQGDTGGVCVETVVAIGSPVEGGAWYSFYCLCDTGFYEEAVVVGISGCSETDDPAGYGDLYCGMIGATNGFSCEFPHDPQGADVFKNSIPGTCSSVEARAYSN